MARLTVTGLDRASEWLSSVYQHNIDQAAMDAVDAAKVIARDALRDSIAGCADRGYATGELAASVIADKTKVSGGGYAADVKPAGTDHKGVRNGEKLGYLEHGTSRQAARPVMRGAIEAARGPCEAAMREKLQAALGN